MTLYGLYYEDSNNEGAREHWNTFYTPLEVFDTDAARKARKAFLTTKCKTFEYHEIEFDVMTAADATQPLDVIYDEDDP